MLFSIMNGDVVVVGICIRQQSKLQTADEISTIRSTFRNAMGTIPLASKAAIMIKSSITRGKGCGSSRNKRSVSYGRTLRSCSARCWNVLIVGAMLGRPRLAAALATAEQPKAPATGITNHPIPTLQLYTSGR